MPIEGETDDKYAAEDKVMTGYHCPTCGSTVVFRYVDIPELGFYHVPDWWCPKENTTCVPVGTGAIAK
jgi:hypothetical protein